VTFALDEVKAQLATLRPEGRVLELSARTGDGLDAWCRLIEERLAAKRG
jgi:Ni2+-binding GTPase involved in maturation of urease and hydrogenase